MKIVWSPLSLKRAHEIATHISHDKPLAAKKWIDQIFNKVKTLKKFPNKGRLVPEVNKSFIREILWNHYRIVYQLGKKQVSILTIRHGRQILSPKEIMDKST